MSSTCILNGITEHNSTDAQLSICAGGTGIKVIRPLFAHEHRYFPFTTWNSFITRPWTPDVDYRDDGLAKRNIAVYFQAADVCSFHPTTGLPLERGGKAIWRIMNIHYNSWAARSLDSCNLILSRLFQIAIENEVDIVSGEFNKGRYAISAALDDLLNAYS